MPNTPKKLHQKMLDAKNAGKYALALEISHNLLAQFPEFTIGHLEQAKLLYKSARYDEAEATLHRIIPLLSDRIINHAYAHLGHLHRAQGNYKKAEQHYRQAIEYAPHKAARHIYLGALLAKQGDLTAAEQAHRDATRCPEGDIDEAYLNLGYVLRAQERYQEALDCFDKALEITPDYEAAIEGMLDMKAVLEYLNGND